MFQKESPLNHFQYDACPATGQEIHFCRFRFNQPRRILHLQAAWAEQSNGDASCKRGESLCFGVENGSSYPRNEQGFNGNGNGNGANGLLEHPKKKTAQPPAAASSSDVKESQVTFQTMEGVQLRGAPVRVTRHSVVFELYNPGIAPRLSEALGGFQIILQGRTVYSGRAVVSNIVDAGTKIICEATLNESSWADLNLVLAFGTGRRTGEGIQNVFAGMAEILQSVAGIQDRHRRHANLST